MTPRTALAGLVSIALATCMIANAGGREPSAASAPQAQSAPRRLTLTGDLGAHDPTLFRAGNTYYVFSTGLIQTEDDPGGILIHRSTGAIAGPWETVGAVPVPKWVKDGYHASNVWAPSVVRNGNTYSLYYAVSEFGKNHSAIGLATSTTPGDPQSWQDRGPILKSEPGDDDNAIDPMVFQDGGQWWITWGSFWSGLKLQKLGDMRAPTGPVISLASRPGVQDDPVEAPTIIKRGQYYYLFMSWDLCCRGADSTYKIAVGRSASVIGPYLDKNGKRLNEGGGSVLLTGRGNLRAAGGEDVLRDGQDDYLVYHSYDALQNYAPTMSIEKLGWVRGWPVVK